MKDQHDISTRGLISSSEYAMHETQTQAGISGPFALGDRVEVIGAKNVRGRIVGWYRTDATPSGYVVQKEGYGQRLAIYDARTLKRIGS